MKNTFIFFTIILLSSCTVKISPPDNYNITQADIDFFLEESYAPYGEDSGIKSLKDLKKSTHLDPEEIAFYSFRYIKNVPDAIDFYSKKLSLDRNTAYTYLVEIFTSVNIHSGCLEKNPPKNCPKTYFNEPRLKSVQKSSHALELYTAIAKNYDQSKYGDIVISLMNKDKKSLLTLFDYSRDIYYLKPLTDGENTPNDVLIEQMLSAHNEDYHLSDMIALNRFILLAHQQASTDEALVRNDLIFNLFSAGLNSEAYEFYVETIDRNLSAYLSKNHVNIFNCEKCRPIKSGIIAYQLQSMDKDSAKLLLQETSKILKDSQVNADDKFFQEVISPKLPPKQLFNYLVYGVLDANKTENKSGDIRNWMGSLADSFPIVKIVSASYLTKNGMDEIASYVIKNGYYGNPTHFLNSQELGSTYLELCKTYENKLGLSSSKSLTQQLWEKTPYRHLVQYVEVDENNFIKRKISSENKLTIPLPVPDYALLRLEEFNGEWYIIYKNGVLDPTGEVPASGYWLNRTYNKGTIWDQPTYLGMQEFYPYQIIPKSKIPFVNANGLYLEVKFREIDEKSITFPPVGLRFKSEKDSRIIHISIDKLYADDDRDGITNVVEMKIGTAANNPDSDNDGILDSRDTLPLIPYDPKSRQFNDAAISILSTVIGIDQNAITPDPNSPNELFSAIKTKKNHGKIDYELPEIEPEKTVFLTGSAEIFKGLQIPIRLIFIDENNPPSRTGIFLPTDVSGIFPSPDRTEFFVIWNSGWAGGSLRIYLDNGKYKIQHLTGWIT